MENYFSGLILIKSSVGSQWIKWWCFVEDWADFSPLSLSKLNLASDVRSGLEASARRLGQAAAPACVGGQGERGGGSRHSETK